MIVSPDAAGQIDGLVSQNILAHMPELGCAIVPISWFPSFKFQPPNLYGQKYVLIDFLEPHPPNEEYEKFHAWTRSNPPALTFRRELSQTQAGEAVRPVEWPCRIPPEPIQSKEDFDKRPIQVFYCWGYSNQSRPLLHAEIFKAMTTHGIEVVSSFDQLEATTEFHPRTWVSIHVHHSVRKPIEYVMKWQRQSKITVSLYGNGRKSFRSTEAPVNSIMAMPADDLAWSYPWLKNINALVVQPETICQQLLFHADNPDEYPPLYDIYLQSQENIDRYRPQRYVSEYIVPAIKGVL